jgi:hypothetical protein
MPLEEIVAWMASPLVVGSWIGPRERPCRPVAVPTIVPHRIRRVLQSRTRRQSGGVDRSGCSRSNYLWTIGWRSLIITGAQLQWFWFCAQTNSGSVHLSTEVLNHHNIVDPLNVSHSASTTVSLIYHIRARHRNETNVWEFRYRVNENNTGPVNVRFAARLGFVNELGFTS